MRHFIGCQYLRAASFTIDSQLAIDRAVKTFALKHCVNVSVNPNSFFQFRGGEMKTVKGLGMVLLLVFCSVSSSMAEESVCYRAKWGSELKGCLWQAFEIAGGSFSSNDVKSMHKSADWASPGSKSCQSQNGRSICIEKSSKAKPTYRYNVSVR